VPETSEVSAALRPFWPILRLPAGLTSYPHSTSPCFGASLRSGDPYESTAARNSNLDIQIASGSHGGRRYQPIRKRASRQRLRGGASRQWPPYGFRQPVKGMKRRRPQPPLPGWSDADVGPPRRTAGVRGDSAADLGAAVTGRVRAGGLPGRKRGGKKKEGRWSVRELRRNAPKFPVDSCREGAPPAFHGAGKTFRPCAAQNIGRNRGDCRILFEAGKAKWKSRARHICPGAAC